MEISHIAIQSTQLSKLYNGSETGNKSNYFQEIFPTSRMPENMQTVWGQKLLGHVTSNPCAEGGRTNIAQLTLQILPKYLETIMSQIFP